MRFIFRPIGNRLDRSTKFKSITLMVRLVCLIRWIIVRSQFGHNLYKTLKVTFTFNTFLGVKRYSVSSCYFVLEFRKCSRVAMTCIVRSDTFQYVYHLFWTKNWHTVLLLATTLLLTELNSQVLADNTENNCRVINHVHYLSVQYFLVLRNLFILRVSLEPK